MERRPPIFSESMSCCWLFNTIYVFSSKHTDASLEHSGSNYWSYAAKFGQWNRRMPWSPWLRKSPVPTHTHTHSYTQILIYYHILKYLYFYIYIHICRKDEVDRIRALHNSYSNFSDFSWTYHIHSRMVRRSGSFGYFLALLGDAGWPLRVPWPIQTMEGGSRPEKVWGYIHIYLVLYIYIY